MTAAFTVTHFSTIYAQSVLEVIAIKEIFIEYAAHEMRYGNAAIYGKYTQH